jgi:hypothetical protein
MKNILRTKQIWNDLILYHMLFEHGHFCIIQVICDVQFRQLVKLAVNVNNWRHSALSNCGDQYLHVLYCQLHVDYGAGYGLAVGGRHWNVTDLSFPTNLPQYLWKAALSIPFIQQHVLVMPMWLWSQSSGEEVLQHFDKNFPFVEKFTWFGKREMIKLLENSFFHNVNPSLHLPWFKINATVIVSRVDSTKQGWELVLASS